MPTIYFGTAAKRKNSTLQPTLSTSYSCILKEATSIDNPTFIIQDGSFDVNANMAMWDSRYYFIEDIVSRRNDIWEVRCRLDPLATYKSEILATTAYVLYDSVANTEIPDNRLPLKTTKSVQASTAACPFTPDGGCYILSLTGAHGSTGVYKVDESQLGALIDDLQDIEDNIFDFNGITPPTTPTGSSTWEWIKYVGDYIKYAFDCAVRPITQFFGSGDIPQNIRECKYIPFNVGVTTPQSPVYLGSFLTQIGSLGKLNTDTVHRTTSVNIPWQASDYRRRSPYTDIYLYLPYIGMTKLSSENLVGQSSINVAYTLGLRDGSLIVTVSSGSEIIGQYSGNVAASVPVGISNLNIAKAAQSIIMGAAAVATKSIGAVGMAALNFGDSVTPNFSCVGGLDGVAGIATNQNITCYTVYHDTVAAPNQDLAVIGSPTMCSKSLATLTGFCQCSDAHVSAAADGPILDEIDGYLNSGFYIE